MDVIITLTLAGADTGPFDLYTSSDGYVTPFASNVPKATLLAGALYSIPSDSVNVKIQSLGMCTTPLMLSVPTTTTTTTSSTTTTTTSTTSSTTSTTTTSTTIFIPPPSMGIDMNIDDPVPDNYSITSITFNGGSNLLLSPIMGSDPFTQFSLYPPNIGTGDLVITAVGAAPSISGNFVTIDSASAHVSTPYTGAGSYTITPFVINNIAPVYIQFNIHNSTTTTTTSTSTSTTTTTSTTEPPVPCYLALTSSSVTSSSEFVIDVSATIDNIIGVLAYTIRLFSGFTLIDSVSNTASGPTANISESFTVGGYGTYHLDIIYSDGDCNGYTDLGYITFSPPTTTTTTTEYVCTLTVDSFTTETVGNTVTVTLSASGITSHANYSMVLSGGRTGSIEGPSGSAIEVYSGLAPGTYYPAATIYAPEAPTTCRFTVNASPVIIT